MDCVYCALRTDSLNVAEVNLGHQRLKSLEHAVFHVLTTLFRQMLVEEDI